MRRNIESKNDWQQILGRKILGSNFFWMKLGEKNGEKNFCKEFLGRKQWGACFEGEDFLGEEILLAKCLENFLRVKCHSGKENYTGEQTMFWRKYF